MALSFIGQASAAANSVALPAFTAGDLAIVFAFNNASTTQPSLPAGWTNDTSAGANTCAYRVGYRSLVGGDTTTGTWTNATNIEVIVLRGWDNGNPLGGVAQGSGSSNAPSWTGFTLSDLTGNSWVVLLGGHRTATDMSSLALGSTTNETPTQTGLAMHDVRGTATWSTTSKTVNASSGWFTRAIEVRSDALHDQLSQMPVETLTFPTSESARLSQGAVETLTFPTSETARLSQAGVEVLASRTNVGALSQMPVEVLRQRVGGETWQAWVID